MGCNQLGALDPSAVGNFRQMPPNLANIYEVAAVPRAFPSVIWLKAQKLHRAIEDSKSRLINPDLQEIALFFISCQPTFGSEFFVIILSFCFSVFFPTFLLLSATPLLTPLSLSVSFSPPLSRSPLVQWFCGSMLAHLPRHPPWPLPSLPHLPPQPFLLSS